MLEDPVEAAKGVRLVVMNPPFTNRTKMGEKFSGHIQRAMRSRTDGFESILATFDPEMEGFADKNSIGPLFVALAEKCLGKLSGILAMINPTIALTATSGRQERIVLARRFHIHTLVTSHVTRQINLSQNTSINESIVIARRHEGARPPTRIISLDRFPVDEREARELHRSLSGCKTGLIPGGWGEVSKWPAERIEAGDWSAAVWRSPRLAEEASGIASDETLPRLRDQGMIPAATGQLLRGEFKSSTPDAPGSFPILKSKGADGQSKIQSEPDEYWIPKTRVDFESLAVDEMYPDTRKILQKSAHLLVTAGQRTGSARLTAVASEDRHVGNGWMPVSGTTIRQAKAAAVFLNSTAGRLQLMRNPGRTIDFPTYSAEEAANLRIPDLSDERIVRILADCWRRSAGTTVPQFRDGECEVRRLWDEAVADAMGWDPGELAELRQLLHREPHVRGLGYNQFG